MVDNVNLTWHIFTDSAVQGAQTNRDYVVRKMSDEILEIIRVLQLTTYDEEEWDADDIAIMKKAQVYNTEHNNMSRLMTKPAKWHVCPAKTQTSLGIRPVWQESSLSAKRKLGVHPVWSAFALPRLIWVFAGDFVGFTIMKKVQ